MDDTQVADACDGAKAPREALTDVRAMTGPMRRYAPMLRAAAKRRRSMAAALAARTRKPLIAVAGG